MDYLDLIDHWDRISVVWVNHLHQKWLNYLFIGFSHKLFPIPIYLTLLYLLFKNFKIYPFVLILLGITVSICLADYTSSGIFKPLIARLRPCYSITNLDLPNGCGGRFGFFSSHAANSFSVAVFIFLLLKDKVKHIAYLCFGWSTLVSVSRIYLGVHYPSDILVGALVGSIFGVLVYLVFIKILTKFSIST
jgi:undecaprenyl-diphosphatase